MLTTNLSFLIYSAAMVVLCLNILGLWGYSGSVRGKTNTTPNPEDVATVAKGAALVQVDPPAVARVLRAHRNATDNIMPFAILGLLFVLWGGSPLLTGIFCSVFVASRIAHSLAYLNEKQPWRTITFVLGGIATLVMVGFLVRAMVASI